MPKRFAEAKEAKEANVESVTPPETEPRAETTDSAEKEDEMNRLEKIRENAYMFYEARGCIEGYALDDWLAAEANVMQAARNTEPSPVEA